jgi:hypothetical protein
MENSPNIENKVMAEIKSGKVKLRSKYVFLAEKLGVGSALALSIILAVLFFNLALFYLRASDNLVYLSFGSRGLLAFLDSFPYGLIIIFVISLFVAGFILKKTDTAYKKPFGFLAIFLIIAVTLLGAMLTFTRLAERIEQGMFDPHSPGRFFRPFMERGLNERRGGIVGRVIEVGGGYFIIQTPHGLDRVDISFLEKDLTEEVKVGSWIMAVGDKDQGIFSARLIKVIDERGIPMIERGVRRHFGPPLSLPVEL